MYLTGLIVYVLWAVFLLTLYLSNDMTPHMDVLLRLGALQKKTFYFEQLLAAGFLHANFLHIIFNTMALSSVGRLVEKLKGRLATLTVFICGIIGGSALSVICQKNDFAVSVGASSGIVALFVFVFLESVKKKNKRLAQSLLWSLVFALVPIIPHVDYLGHLGGAVVGAILWVLL